MLAVHFGETHWAYNIGEAPSPVHFHRHLHGYYPDPHGLPNVGSEDRPVQSSMLLQVSTCVRLLDRTNTPSLHFPPVFGTTITVDCTRILSVFPPCMRSLEAAPHCLCLPTIDTTALKL
jgi:hypothetical protein